MQISQPRHISAYQHEYIQHCQRAPEVGATTAYSTTVVYLARMHPSARHTRHPSARQRRRTPNPGSPALLRIRGCDRSDAGGISHDAHAILPRRACQIRCPLAMRVSYLTCTVCSACTICRFDSSPRAARRATFGLWQRPVQRSSQGYRGSGPRLQRSVVAASGARTYKLPENRLVKRRTCMLRINSVQ
jgi:hypothetical protein